MLFSHCVVWLTQLIYVVSQSPRTRKKACHTPPDFLFGTLDPGRKRVGSIRTYKCAPEYQSMGDPTIRCQQDLNWTPLRLTCLACPPPDESFGCGRIMGGQNTLQTTRQYKCKSGLEPPVPVTTTCLPGPDGPIWSKPKNACNGCTSSPSIQGGQHGPPILDNTGPSVVAFPCDSKLITIGLGEVSCIDRNGLPLWTKPVQGCFNTAPRVSRVDHCKSNPCLNGGKCKSSAEKGFTCSCIGGYSGTICEGLKSDCKEILSSGAGTASGTYYMQPKGSQKFQVVCDMDTDGGGWTVIQSRPIVQNTGSTFDKLWNGYKQGFGTVDPAGSFWLGLEKVHQLTKGGSWELRMDIEKDGGVRGAAIYQNFVVGDESTGYKLTIGAYSYDKSPGFIEPGDSFRAHNGAKFTTSDNSNAGIKSGVTVVSCGINYKAGWWYISRYCYFADLNGPTSWFKFNEWKSLSKTKMMIRKK